MGFPAGPHRRRLLVVGAAGLGKSWAVRDWLAGESVTWTSTHVPEAPVDSPWLVIDELPRLDAASARTLAAELDRLPAETRIVLISRTPWPGRLPADTVVVGAPDLLLTEVRVAEVLAEEYGVRAADRAAEVHQLTGGWPSLVHLAGRHLRAGSLGNLCAPGTEVDSFVTEHVLRPLTGSARRLLRHLTVLDPVCDDLLEPRDRDTLRLLAQLGLAVAAPTAGNLPAVRWLHAVPAIAALLDRRWPLPGPARRHLHGHAASWYAQRRLWGPAVLAELRAGSAAGAADRLRDHGDAILAAGGAGLVIEACAALDGGDPRDGAGDARLRLLYGEALCVTGRLDDALAQLTPLAADRIEIEPALAWRLGVVHYLRAEHRAAFDALARGRIDRADTVDEALLLAWTATAHWSVGDADACGELAERARRAALAARDDQALAVVHVTLALYAALIGDRDGNAEHYAKALGHAEAAGDAVQAARIRVNRVSQLLEEARYADALAASGDAVGAAEAVAHIGLRTVSLINRAEALLRAGRLEEAERCADWALAICQRAGSRTVAYALIVLGDVRSRRGQRSLARAAYEEAARAAAADGVVQCLVPALAGLARVVAAEDPAAGLRYAEQAVSRASGPLATRALLAVGWVAIAAGDRTAAAEAADRAEASARRHRDRAGLAEVLELRASTAEETAARRIALREAARTWQATGARLDADRVACLLGQLPGASPEDRLAARRAQATLDAVGLEPPRLAGVTGAPPRRVAIRTLGRFEVVVDDEPLAASAWQSRKARDLLRILVARRGRRVAREELAALLWPDDADVQRVAHRLSVALSTLRAVLDPDRRQPPDHYVAATPAALSANVSQLDIDLEVFLAEVEAGRGLVERQRPDEAREVLAAAVRRYAGDAFEDEPYDDWSIPVREETRAAYLHCVRALATLAAGRGAVDDAIGYLLRILARDPYDEQSHRELVDLLATAGRHGEAGRARTRYAAAMHEIGLTPAGRSG